MGCLIIGDRTIARGIACADGVPSSMQEYWKEVSVASIMRFSGDRERRHPIPIFDTVMF